MAVKETLARREELAAEDTQQHGTRTMRTFLGAPLCFRLLRASLRFGFSSGADFFSV